jgi:hypothetical protein
VWQLYVEYLCKKTLVIHKERQKKHLPGLETHLMCLKALLLLGAIVVVVDGDPLQVGADIGCGNRTKISK